MKFSVNKQDDAERTSVSTLDVIQAQTELQAAYESLFEAQKNLKEVCQVMADIDAGIKLITKYPKTAVEQLNISGQLEDLLNVPAKLITVEKAQEGLDKAATTALESFMDKARNVIAKIIQFIKGLVVKIRQSYSLFTKNNDSLINTITDRQLNEFIDKHKDNDNLMATLRQMSIFNHPSYRSSFDKCVKMILTSVSDVDSTYRSVLHDAIDSSYMADTAYMRKKVTETMNEVVGIVKTELLLKLKGEVTIDVKPPKSVSDIKAIYSNEKDRIKEVSTLLETIEKQTANFEPGVWALLTRTHQKDGSYGAYRHVTNEGPFIRIISEYSGCMHDISHVLTRILHLTEVQMRVISNFIQKVAKDTTVMSAGS